MSLAKNLMFFRQIHCSSFLRSAGGSIQKRGEVHEEEYFLKQRQEQLNKLKTKKMSDKEFVAERIKKHTEAMEYHKQMVNEYKSGKKLDEVKKKLKTWKWKAQRKV